MRSRSAATLLAGSGFQNVHSMEGGIRAWNGMVAHGEPEAGMPYFTAAQNIRDFTALAWALEEGSRRFYEGVRDRLSGDKEAVSLFTALVTAEENHKQHLLDAYQKITGEEPDLRSLLDGLNGDSAGETMEGGISVREALEWVSGQGIQEILELSMSLEINAFDLYVKMSRIMEDKESQKIFKTLSEEELAHLERLSALLDKRL